MSLPSAPKSWSRAAVSLCSAASIVACTASHAGHNVRGTYVGVAANRGAPTTRPAARSQPSRGRLFFESIKLIFGMVFSLLPASTTAVAAATAAATPAGRPSAPARGASAAAAGGTEAGISMVALRARRAALPNPAEKTAVLVGGAPGDLPIAHSLGGSGLRGDAARLRR